MRVVADQHISGVHNRSTVFARCASPSIPWVHYHLPTQMALDRFSHFCTANDAFFLCANPFPPFPLPLTPNFLASLRKGMSMKSVNSLFLARDVIYTSRTYAMMSVSVCLSVCLSVTFVHCGHRVQWIPDIFACLDRWMFATY